MKSIIFFGFIFSLYLLSACNSATTEDEIAEYFPGTYTRSAQNEFGKEYDTLILTMQNEAAKQYRITRNWRYERVRDGQFLEPEYKITSTSAVYDESTKTLKDQRSGITYSIDQTNHALFAGSTKYEKLK
ncbi:MAG TPA: hypothetical protein VMR70_15795 [Flavisolibacter sp.]|nr:hypothetical protein [Flavisolibacter sp.]